MASTTRVMAVACTEPDYGFLVSALSMILLAGCAGPTMNGREGRLVRFESGAGVPAIEIRRDQELLVVRDRDGRMLVRIARTGRQAAATGARGDSLGYVTVDRRADDPARFRWQSIRSEISDFVLKLESDGDLKIKDSAGDTLYKLKRRDYGFKIVDAEGIPVGRVRQSRSGKISIRDGDGITYLSTRDEIPVAVSAVLAAPRIPFSRAVALAAMLWWEQDG